MGFLLAGPAERDPRIESTFWAIDSTIAPCLSIPSGKVTLAGLPDFCMIRSAISSCAQLGLAGKVRSEEQTSELQSLMRISSAVISLKQKRNIMIRKKKTK